MFVVDTNILLYAAERSFPEHRPYRARLDSWRRGADAWYITWPIVYEFLRVTTDARVFNRPWSLGEARRFVEALLLAPGLRVLSATERHAEVADRVIQASPDLRGNVLHDMHTAVLMREHGIRRICTRDMDFHRFDFIEVIDPLTDL